MADRLRFRQWPRRPRPAAGRQLASGGRHSLTACAEPGARFAWEGEGLHATALRILPRDTSPGGRLGQHVPVSGAREPARGRGRCPLFISPFWPPGSGRGGLEDQRRAGPRSVDRPSLMRCDRIGAWLVVMSPRMVGTQTYRVQREPVGFGVS